MTALTRLTWNSIITGCSRRGSSGIPWVPINRLAVLLGSILFVAATVSGQQVEPSPTATPIPQATTTQSPGQETPAGSPAPTASPSPEPQVAPDLLPNPNALPPQPSQIPALRDLIPKGIQAVIPGSLLPAPGSAEQMEMDKIRFRQIRTIAARNPFAVYLWRKAQSQKTDEMKREYLRVYYLTMCDEMRKLEPRLKGVIDGFEAGKVGLSSPAGQRPTIPGRDIPRYNAVERAPSQH